MTRDCSCLGAKKEAEETESEREHLSSLGLDHPWHHGREGWARSRSPTLRAKTAQGQNAVAVLAD